LPLNSHNRLLQLVKLLVLLQLLSAKLLPDSSSSNKLLFKDSSLLLLDLSSRLLKSTHS